MESSREGCLIAESGLGGDIDERQLRDKKQLLGVLDSTLGQPTMAGDAEAGLEGAREMADRQIARAREIDEANAAVEVLAQQLRRSTLLPGRKTPIELGASPPRRAVAVQDVRGDDQLELVEGQGRWRPFDAPQERQNALRDLREDH